MGMGRGESQKPAPFQCSKALEAQHGLISFVHGTMYICVILWTGHCLIYFQAGGMPPDSKQAFKAEWEALEITDHNWALRHQITLENS